MKMLQYGDKIQETDTFLQADHQERKEEYSKTLESMIHIMEQYNKFIEVESEKDEKEMSIYQVGKLNPKNELMRNIEEMTQDCIAENLNLLIKHQTF